MNAPTPYTTRSTSARSAVVDQVIVLSEQLTTRKVAKVMLVQNPRDPAAGIKVTIFHERKSPKGEWESAAEIKLNALKAGEGVRIDLDSLETMQLILELKKIEAIREQAGLPMGERSFTVIEGEPELSARLQQLMSSPENAEQILAALNILQPDIVARVTDLKLAEKRRAALDEFGQSMLDGRDEPYWQDFFEKHDWIFGYGLNYQVIRGYQTQPHFGGMAVTGRGAQKGDFLGHTVAEAKFTVLVEIKTPQTQLLASNRYRNGAWGAGDELSGGIAQIQANCRTWEVEGSRREVDRDALGAAGINTVHPKGILVIGHTEQLGDQEKINSFELFRRSLVEPEIITFDELYARASFIVEHASRPASETVAAPPTEN